MNSNHVIKNPWGRGKVSLKGKKLNENEKMYLAQLVNKDGKTCEYVANTYSLSKSVIGKYAKSIKNGVKLHTGDGQPPAIDNISSAALLDILSNNNENANVENLKSLISNACEDSHNRRSNDTKSNSKVFKVSNRTIKKYFDKYMVKSSKRA